MRWLIAFSVLSLASCSASGAIVTGTISEVGEGQLTISAADGSGSQTLQVPTRTRIELDDKSAKLSDLRPGFQVKISASRKGEARLILATSAGAPAASNTPPPGSPRTPVASPGFQAGPAPPTDGSDEWPQFGGPNRDNRSATTGINENWPADGPPRLWTISGLGEGYSSVSVVGDRVFTIGTKGGQETVFALDLASGRAVWSTPIGTVYKDGQGNGPRSTPTYDNGKLYCLGANGDLARIDAASGQIDWNLNILQKFGGQNIVWGISESPLVDGDTVVVTPGSQNGQGTVVGLNKESGATSWTCSIPGNPQPSYSSPIKLSSGGNFGAGGLNQYVVFTSKGLVGISVENAMPLWGDDSASNGTANCSIPLQFGSSVFYSSDYGTGGSLVRINNRGGGFQAAVAFHTDDLKNHHGGMAIDGDYVYGTSGDAGILACVDLNNGQTIWRDRSVGKGATIYVDGKLIVRSERGPVALVRATSNGYEEMARFDQPERSGRPAWPHPVVAKGRLFLRDQDKLLCFNVK
ncbi:PQQ-binding-like beta-propeller repeat protein [Stratiformator vulcanicus]|uniref:Outer membrane biogenesis protein BamB n=1 Tax=Stratiformator vulcanicus TaxID=2527980 RepID=A0A517R4R9_9PLAN|nr:PQQ-binding-like beta-propeller repeat protein [Stratiformator vulcanicus]QDT38860.1 outer membrane biogenesis protein BamB [Stratiformator vulcanicus]